MKLIHVKQARSVWLLDVQDLNPKGKEFTGELIRWIKVTYSFAVAPDVQEALAKAGTSNASGLVFQRGRFQAGEDSVIEIVSLAIHNDGIVIDTTSSTEEADRFAADILRSAAREFGLSYEADMVRKRLYVSTLIVKSDLVLANIHPGLTAFSESISRALGNHSSQGFQLAGLGFWTEPSDSGVHKTFSLAPQVGKPLSEGRYFSEAPLKTEDHLRLLGELERVLASTK